MVQLSTWEVTCAWRRYNEDMPSSAAQVRIALLLVCLVLGALILYKSRKRHEQPQKSTDRLAAPSKGVPRSYNLPRQYIIPPPKICDQNSTNGSVQFFVVVISAVQRLDWRRAVRRTWGRDLLSLENNRLLFLLGRANGSEEQRRVFQESARHMDIVQGDLLEDYRNLTEKSVMALRLALTHCPRVSFLLKADDDTYINVPNLIAQVGKLPKDSIYGSMHANTAAIRDPSMKWSVTNEEYKPEFYPDFVSGSAYVVGGDVVGTLYAQTGRVRPLWLEDVYITGLCAEAARIRRVGLRTFYSVGVSTSCKMKKMVTSHYMTPERMMEFWRDLHNKDLKCK